MAKFILVALAAASILTSVEAQARSQARAHVAHTETLKPYEAYAPGSREQPTDMKVMGLSVPNGWRAPDAVNNRN